MTELTTRQKNLLGYTIISGVIILAITAVVLIIITGSDKFCPKDKIGHTIILIDKTDLFTEQQKQWIRNEVLDVNNIQDIVGRGEKLSVFILDESPIAAPRPQFSRCRPKTATEANIVYETPDTIQNEYEQNFRKPLVKMVEEVVAPKGATLSPIFELIHEISRLNDFKPDYPFRRLVIFSDGLHNTNELSFYGICKPILKTQGECPGYEEIKKRHESYLKRVAPKFSGQISVKLYILRRPGYDNVPAADYLATFWTAFFMDHGIKVDPKFDIRIEPNIY